MAVTTNMLRLVVALVSVFVLFNLVNQKEKLNYFYSASISRTTGEWNDTTTATFQSLSSLRTSNEEYRDNQTHYTTAVSDSNLQRNNISLAMDSGKTIVVQNVLRDIHVVMIGDSIMRYQYLSLAYRLRHGVWFHDSMWNYDLVNEQSFENPFHDRTIAEFCYQTNQILQPMEVCDCLSSAPSREPNNNNNNNNSNTWENRYFYDPVLNNSLVYLGTNYGNNKQIMRGRLLPHQVRSLPDSWQRTSLQQQSDEALWHYNNWADTIVKYVRDLDPKPRNIVMNAGISEIELCEPGQSVNNGNEQWFPDIDNFMQVVRNSTESRFVWRTTTFSVHGRNPGLECDKIMCSLLSTCVNMSFTKRIDRELYWDDFHVKEPVYRVSNELLLDLLGSLPSDYKRLDLSIILPDSTGASSNVNVLEDVQLPAIAAAQAAENQSSAVLRDIHIVMIGDSLMRYQYLSLAYRLRFGVWFHKSLWHYDLVQQASFTSPFHSQTWGEFFYQSSNMLYPLEVCDCYRRPLDVVENRYFYDSVLNNSLVYINALGHWKRRPHPMRGRILPSQVHQERQNRSSYFKKDAFRERRELAWAYTDWADAISGYIRRLDPKPTHIVMNAGGWPHNFCDPNRPLNQTTALPLSNETQNLLRAMEMMPEIRFAWRTTTFDKDGNRHIYECDDVMCQLLPLCVNASFTRYIKKNRYWDKLHFYEPIYRVINEVMLEDFGLLPNGYLRFDLQYKKFLTS